MAQDSPSPGSPFILKVLSGVHLGAEVELAAGTLTVGRAPICDIILEDRLLADKHLEIARDGATVQVRVLASPAAIDGKSVEPGTYPVAPYTVFTIGSTHLAYGERDAAWPALHFNETIPSEPSPAEQKAAAAPVTTREPSRRRSPAWALAAGLLLVLCGVGLAFAQWVHHAQPAKRDAAAEMASVKNVLKQFAQNSELEAVDDGHKILVRGRVADDATSVRLHQALNYLNIPLGYDISSHEALIDQCRSLISMEDLGLVLQADDLHTVAIVGYIPTRSKMVSFQHGLTGFVPPSINVRSRVVVGEEAASQMAQNIQEYFLAPYLQITVTPANVTLTGLVPKSQSEAWQKLVASWQQRPFAPYLNLSQVYLTDESKLEEQIFGAPITALHNGDVAWVRLGDNRLLHLGSVLGRGWVLDEVGPASVRVRQGAAVLEFPFSPR